MSLKWENIKVLISPLSNNIYLGKTDKSGMFATDKSTDRTQEVMAAIMGHLDNELKDGETKVSYSCEAGTLTWERKKKDA